jgi:sterol desaturase/sphingolipid hydroxylase (fatty acid hydroxylase superfamily)
MTIFSVDRNTPWEDIFTKPFVLPLSVLTGLLLNACLLEGYLLPFFIYLIDTLIDEMNFYVGHSSLKVIYPKPFSYFYISPALHWLHHSDNPNHYDCNFGTKYPFWDKLFGSYLDESYLKDNFKFGVPNTEYNKYHPLISYYFLPLMKIIRRLRRSFA